MRVLKSTKVVGSVNWSIVDCTLRNLDGVSATISCGYQSAIPDEFRLMIPSDNSIQNARVVWRKDTEIGMELFGEKTAAPINRPVSFH